MGIGKGGSPTTTSNSQNQNVASVPNGLSNFQDIYNRANAASQTPYQPYGGQLVAPLTDQQQAGVSTINSAGPITDQQIQSYMNPYQSQVMNALTQNINETNGQQLQQVRGNAISQHALGGDREAVAEAELARQQNLGNAPTLANTLQQGYSQALATAQQQQQQRMQEGEAQFNVGTVGQQTNQAQNTAAYQQYLQQLAFPYQQAQFLAGIGIPAAGAMGGQQYQTGYANQVMTPPGISVGQGVAGLGLLAGGLGFGLGGFSNPFGSQPNTQTGNGELASGAAARGGRMEHRYPGGRAIDSDNPYAVDPWNIKAVDITGGSPGTPLQTPQNQVHPAPGISISQGGGQQSNPLSNISQDISAAKGLYGLGKSAAGLFGSGATASAIPFADAASLGGIGSDAAAMAGAGAGAAVAGETAADIGLAELLPAAMFLKRGGATYPKHLAMGGDAGENALQDLAAKAQQSGPLAQMMADRIMFNKGTSMPHARGGNVYPRRADGGDSDDDQPWALESRWPTQGTDTAIPPWKSADPRGDTSALKNYGMTQAPEVSPDTSRAIPMPQQRPSPYVKPDDAELPDASEPQSSPTRVNVQKGTGFDPAAASYQDIMNKDNFKNYAPQHQSLMGLLKDPKTRGDALMEIGLRILAAPPTSKSGLSEMAQGALGTMQSYNQFSKDATTAQEKAQELAAKLKGQSNTDDYNDERLKIEKQKMEALKDYHDNITQQRFQKLLHGNLVPGNIQYPGPTGAVVKGYFDKGSGGYYDEDHNPIPGGRWAGTNAVDLGLSQPPGSQPARPASVPEGSRWSPSVKMWKDPAGKIYDAGGQLVQQ